jgi:hypothetical protein
MSDCHDHDDFTGIKLYVALLLAPLFIVVGVVALVASLFERRR